MLISHSLSFCGAAKQHRSKLALFTQQKNIKHSPMTKIAENNMFCHSEMSESEACKQASDVSIHQSTIIYNFLQARSMGLLEISSLNAPLYASGGRWHTQVCTDIEITAESNKWLETIIKVRGRVQHAFTFLQSISSCISFPKRCLFSRQDCCHSQHPPLPPQSSMNTPQGRNTFLSSCKWKPLSDLFFQI